MPEAATKNLTQDAINTIRFLSVDGVEKAKSGHPGLPMGMAAAAYTLWTKFLKHNPKNPQWPNRDRFVLSAGHGSMLVYSLLHLTGYNLSLDDLKNFRQWKSKTPGHPEYGDTDGIETTTGPLGQGIANAVGMAIGQRYLNQLFSGGTESLLDHRIYGLCGDGDLQEGISSEACSLAGHLGLGSIILIYDDNHITIDGNTDLSFSEDVGKRFEAYNWHVANVSDANDIDAMAKAVEDAKKTTDKPHLIITRSQIGFGSPNKANTAAAHGAPLGPEEAKLSKENLKFPADSAFFVSKDVKTHFEAALANGKKFEAAWSQRFEAWAKANPEKAALFKRLQDGKLPEGWEKHLPDFSTDEKLATRAASGKVINALAAHLPELIGGSADLAPSNNTLIKGAPDFSKTGGRNMRFGVREHAMAAALNGMALNGMLIPYGGTFFIFTDYMKGGMRLGALMKQRVIYVLTHDSIGLGEDGPTHQPIEQLAHLRATPNFTMIRPADATETAAAWKYALENKSGPTGLVLTRQGLPVLKKDKFPNAGQVEKGGYILKDAKNQEPILLLIATGSEVSLALQAQEKLEADGTPTRVVSLPSWEIFDAQSKEYRESVLPAKIRARVSIEALSTFGWERYVGLDGAVIGMNRFGASAPGATLMEKFGFTVDNIVQKAKSVLN